jgi:hypothetical protein
MLGRVGQLATEQQRGILYSRTTTRRGLSDGCRIRAATSVAPELRPARSLARTTRRPQGLVLLLAALVALPYALLVLLAAG